MRAIAWMIVPCTRLIWCVAVEKHIPGFNAVCAQHSHSLPWIVGEALANRTLGLGLDNVQHPLTVTQRPTADNEAAGSEAVHERGMLGPRLLLTHRTVRLPRGSANTDNGEETGCVQLQLQLPRFSDQIIAAEALVGDFPHPHEAGLLVQAPGNEQLALRP